MAKFNLNEFQKNKLLKFSNDKSISNPLRFALQDMVRGKIDADGKLLSTGKWKYGVVYRDVPLNEAVSNLKPKLVEFLIELGADIHLRVKLENSNDCTFLMVLADIRYYRTETSEVAKILIKKGINVNAIEKKFGFSALSKAMISPTILKKLIKILLDNGADVNIKTKEGYTSLMFGCQNPSDLESIKWVVEKGADLNVQNRFNETALYLICKGSEKQHAKIEVIEYLLSKGADPTLGKDILQHAGRKIKKFFKQKELTERSGLFGVKIKK